MAESPRGLPAGATRRQSPTALRLTSRRSVLPSPMSATPNPTTTVEITPEGELVIPVELLREFAIEEGTRVVLLATDDGILIRPENPSAIQRARGLLQRQAGGSSLGEVWAEHKALERRIEEQSPADPAPPTRSDP